MARAPARKRKRTSDFFEGIYDDEGNAVGELSEESSHLLDDIAQTVAESMGHRYGAKSTIQHMDRILAEYNNFMIQKFKQDGREEELFSLSPDTDDNDPLFFPPILSDFYNHARFYLTACVHLIKPQRKAEDKPKLSTVLNRRWTLMTWARRKMDLDIVYHKFQHATNEAIHYAVEKYGIGRKVAEKPYFGKDELRFLIDHDMAKTWNIAVAENHALAWIMGCVCGVRPGAIGRSPQRNNDFLRWRDIEIHRELEGEHRFLAKIKFRHMKGAQADAARTTDAAMGNLKSCLQLVVRSPQSANNVPLSLPHRLLIVALRRGILADYETYNDLLLEDDKDAPLRIAFKEEALDLPIVERSGPRGLKLVSGKAVSAAGLTAYMKSRAISAGLSSETSFYAWRRKAGTTIDKVAGRDMARKFLNHHPNSTTFEDYYEQDAITLDVGAIAYGEDHVAGGLALTEISSEVLYRAQLHLSPFKVNLVVKDYCEQYLDRNAPNQKAELQRLRRDARAAIYEQAKEESARTLTKGQFEARVAELKDTSNFMKIIEERVQKNREDADATADDEAGSQDDEVVDEYDGDGYDVGDDTRLVFGDEDAEYGDDTIDDGDDTAGDSTTDPTEDDANTEVVEIVTDLPNDLDSSNDIPYRLTVETFFELMLETQLAPGDKRTCPECLADDTTTEEEKAHLYRSRSDLDRHLTSNFHLPHQQWSRHIRNEIALAPKGELKCPYSTTCEYHTNKPSEYYSHCSSMYALGVGNDHYESLKAIGFQSPDWDKPRRSPEEAAKKKREHTREYFTRHSIFPQLVELSQPQPARMPVTHPAMTTLGPVPRSAYLPPSEPPTIAALPRLTLQSFREYCDRSGMTGRTVGFPDHPIGGPGAPPFQKPTWAELSRGTMTPEMRAHLALMGNIPEDDVTQSRPHRARDLS